MLPHGTGSDVRVAVFAEGEKAKEAEDAGADVGRIRRPRHQGRGRLRRFRRRHRDAGHDGHGRQARPHPRARAGSCRTPKAGTVTFDIGKAVRDSKAGKLEYRTDRGANVHLTIGKKSFDAKALLENYATVLDEIVRAKPSAAKGRYIRTITLTTSMGPGIHVDPQKTRGVVEEMDEQEAAVPA
jgi:large subunit ribosomal protein L1